ncbi:MAG: hypothetical protein ACR2PI_09010 [Hyphomicrobiaceae bacterium]
MKEFIIAVVAIIVLAVAAHYGLDAMDWSAESKYSSGQVRL